MKVKFQEQPEPAIEASLIMPFAVGEGTITGVLAGAQMDPSSGGIASNVTLDWDSNSPNMLGTPLTTTPARTTIHTSRQIVNVAYVRDALRSLATGPSATAPTSPAPVDGQLWLDTTSGMVNVRYNNAWTPIAPDRIDGGTF